MGKRGRGGKLDRLGHDYGEEEEGKKKKRGGGGG